MPGTTPQQGSRFTTAIDFVRMDVTPRDSRSGQFIPNIDRSEFVILEDGVEQKIESMTLVVGGRVTSDTPPPSMAAPEGIILPPSRPVADTSGRIFLILIDDLHLEFKLTSQLRQLLKKIDKELIHEGDQWAAVSSGYSSIAQDLTYDRKRMSEIISKVSGAGMKPAELVSAGRTADGPAEVRYRANTAFSTAYEALKNFEKITNRRKIIVYISSGYNFNPFPEARARAENARYSKNPDVDTSGQTDPALADSSLLQNPFDHTGAFSEADLVRELSELTRQANRSNTTIYTIDPRGLTAGPDIDENEVRTTEYMDYVRTTQDTLRSIAELTGGFAVVNQNDFDKALKKIDAASSDYYVIGYTSNNPDPLRRRRRVEIRVKRPDVALSYRPEYTLKPPPRVVK
jgi:VWFA-related protein